MRTRSAPFVLAAAILAAAGQPTALASTLNWSNVGGGSAATTTNWNPIALPAAADDLTYNLVAAYAVSFGATTTASRTQAFRQGAVTLTMSSPHTTSNGVAIGDLAGDVSTVTLTTGTWTSGPAGFVNIGDAANATGTFNINDDDADFVVAGNSDLFVGNNGLGTMNITAGGAVTCNDLMHVGQGSNATGHLTVSGFVASFPFPISTLDVNGAGESRWGNGGDATVNVSNGAAARFAGDLVIGNLSTSIANVTVQGAGLIVGATVDVAGDLLLGRNTSAGTAAGVATLNVNDDGRVLVGDTLFVGGDPDGGTATLHTDVGGLISARSLTIGGGSTLDLDGGSINIDGGTFTWNVPGVSPTINGSPGNPVVTMTNGATATLSRAAPGGQVLTIGTGTGSNHAGLEVRSGSDLILNDGLCTLGSGADDIGGLLVSGAGSTFTFEPTGSSLVVADAGFGNFTVELGASVVGDALFVAADPGSHGVVLLQNTGTAAAFNRIFVGGNSGLAGGAGVLAINDLALLNVPSPTGFIRVYPTGTFIIDTASAPVAAIPFDLRGTLQVHNSAFLDALTLDAASGSLITAHPDRAGTATIDARTHLLDGSTLQLINGDLTIGDAASTAGFQADRNSIINVGSRTLTLSDADEALVGTVALTGGTLAAPNGIDIQLNGTIDGRGTITTPDLFFPTGGSVITATGGGITINGMLRNNSGTIDGTAYFFNQHPSGTAGGWTGAGTINAPVVFNANSSVNALANMTLGDNTNFGITFNAGSELHADIRTVTLLDANGLALPSVTDVNLGGRIVCAQSMVLSTGRRASGRGEFSTPLLNVFGTIAPGELVGVSSGDTGILTVAGSLFLNSGSNTLIELQGVLQPEFDRIQVNGPATLGGNLDVSFINGFNPTSPLRIAIIRASSFSGSFSTISLPPRTRLESSATELTLVFCPADFNASGTLSVQDIFDFLAAYFSLNPAADFNASGTISVQDIFDFLAAYFAGC